LPEEASNICSRYAQCSGGFPLRSDHSNGFEHRQKSRILDTHEINELSDQEFADGNWVKSCSILTTTPNAVTSAVHDRMPVILDPDAYDLWLDPGMQDVAAISQLLKPYDTRLMRCYPVSSRVNHVSNDDEDCSRPVEMAEAQNQLFD